jgi:hypothetical protein
MTEFFTLPSDGSAVEKDEEVATPGSGRDYPGSAPGLNVGLIFVNLTFSTAFILLWV